MDNLPQISITGMAWYKEHDYSRIRNIFDDGDKFPNTYAKWLDQAQNNFNYLCAKGNTVIKVYIDPDTFPHWCIERGLGINASSRIEFSSIKALEHFNANKI